jgi:hypothetical protein
MHVFKNYNMPDNAIATDMDIIATPKTIMDIMEISDLTFANF